MATDKGPDQAPSDCGVELAKLLTCPPKLYCSIPDRGGACR